MRAPLDHIPEFPSEETPYFLLPERWLELPPAPGAAGPRRVAYRELGTGRPVLLLHGLWTTGFAFRALLARLAAAGCRAVVPELTPASPGGLEPEPTPERLAELVAELIQALELVTPTVVGHAELGLAGLWLALERPQMVGTLVTLGMSTRLPFGVRMWGRFLGRPGAPERWARRALADPLRTALRLCDYADPSVLCRQELRLLAEGFASLPAALARARALALSLSPGYRQALLTRLEAHAHSGAALPAPLVLVHGARDRLAPPAQGQRLTQLLPGAELFVLEGASGTPQVEQPDPTARAITGAAGR